MLVIEFFYISVCCDIIIRFIINIRDLYVAFEKCLGWKNFIIYIIIKRVKGNIYEESKRFNWKEIVIVLCKGSLFRGKCEY